MQETILLVAQYGIAVPIILTICGLVMQKGSNRWNLLVLLVAGGALSLAIAKLGGYIIHDPRPFVVGHFTPLLAHANDNGFPSDHTLLAAFLGFALLAYTPFLGGIALVAAVGIGTARIAAGVHHLEDIVGSFLIAGIAAFLVQEAIALMQRYLARQRTDT